MPEKFLQTPVPIRGKRSRVKLARWIIFILLYLPSALGAFVFDPEKIAAGSAIRWEPVARDRMAVLLIATLFFVPPGHLPGSQPPNTPHAPI